MSIRMKFRRKIFCIALASVTAQAKNTKLHCTAPSTQHNFVAVAMVMDAHAAQLL
jgi:hypothetical protein